MIIDKLIIEVNRDWGMLAPFVREKAIKAFENANYAGYPLRLFEGWRSPLRQQQLYALGRSEPGAVVTRAKAWQSWHQFGLALDVAYFINKKWSWDGDFEKPSIYFIEQGFEWLKDIERVHYQINGGLKISEAQEIVYKYGVQALWMEVEESES